MPTRREAARLALGAVIAAAATGVLAAGGAVTPATVAAEGARYKVVVHVGDGEPAKWNVALNNVANLQKELGAGNIDIEVVAINAGLGMLKIDSPVGGRVADALRSGVVIVACENSMRAQKLAREDMLGDIGYVRAGVVELLERQRQGYAYLRP